MTESADIRRVALSTSSVYPEGTSSGFEVAGKLGYDGVEVMVGIDAIAADPVAVAKLAAFHQVPVLAIHAPCLLVSKPVWGRTPTARLTRAAEVAEELGAPTVVVHPPFRWQRKDAEGFPELIPQLEAKHGVTIAMENMYPWKAPGQQRVHAEAYLPHWDPTHLPYEHLTLDLSHASTAGGSSLELARSWGERLRHVHLTDGRGSFKDEHLSPGEGDQHADELLRHLVEVDFTGDVILEVNTRSAGSKAQREKVLAEALAFTRRHLAG